MAFASKSLTSAEQNYLQFVREALAIVFAIFVCSFKLVTDNQLARIFHQHAKIPQMTSARLHSSQDSITK